MKGYIYKYTFPNGKVYIGQTRVDPKKRHKQHLAQAKKNSSNRLCQAFREFGDNYQYEIIRTYDIEDPDSLLAILDHEEGTLIEQHQSNKLEFGYNATTGTWHFFHPHIPTEDEKAIEKFKKNVFANEIAERKITNDYDAYDVWEEICDQFDNLPQDEKDEILKTWWKYNGIVGFDADNNVLGVFRNIKEIAEALNVGGNGVRNVLAGKQEKAYGYYWKYGRDYFDFEDE